MAEGYYPQLDLECSEKSACDQQHISFGGTWCAAALHGAELSSGCTSHSLGSAAPEDAAAGWLKASETPSMAAVERRTGCGGGCWACWAALRCAALLAAMRSCIESCAVGIALLRSATGTAGACSDTQLSGLVAEESDLGAFGSFSCPAGCHALLHRELRCGLRTSRGRC